MPFYVGKAGNIVVGGSAKPLTDWSLDIKTEEIDLTNFSSSGWKDVAGGIFSCDISASGPYNGTASVTQGTVATFSLDVDAGGSGPSFSGSALVTSVKIDTSVKDVAKITYTATSSGPWTATP